jgi:hypothetical protein
MAKVVRSEFMGNGIVFWLLCVTIVMIPVAVLYLINGTLRVEEELNDPEEFIKRFRNRRSKG